MNGKPQKNCCPVSTQQDQACEIRTQDCPDTASPLSKACGCERFRVCKIKGDRKLCARMAQLGVLPGSEIELVCTVQPHKCMVKVKGSTISLDQLSADNILVTPA